MNYQKVERMFFMEIIYDYPEIALAKVNGILDYHNSNRVYNELLRCIRRKLNIIIDMSRCRFVTSTGMRMLTLVSKSCVQNGRKMILIHVDDEIDDLMSVTGFVTGFTICNTLDTALMIINEEDKNAEN